MFSKALGAFIKRNMVGIFFIGYIHTHLINKILQHGTISLENGKIHVLNEILV